MSCRSTRAAGRAIRSVASWSTARCGAGERSTCSTSPRRWLSRSGIWPLTGFRPRGDLIYFAVADEESGSAHGMQWMADHEPDAIRADYVLTENGGLHSGPKEQPYIAVNVGEKGVAWRRLRVRGTPGHGSTPFKADNALMTAAAVVQRIGDYRPSPRFHELWTDHGRDAWASTRRPSGTLLDETAHRRRSSTHFRRGGAGAHLHACTHTTFSCNTIGGGGAVADEDQRHPRLRRHRRRRPHACRANTTTMSRRICAPRSAICSTRSTSR